MATKVAYILITLVCGILYLCHVIHTSLDLGQIFGATLLAITAWAILSIIPDD